MPTVLTNPLPAIAKAAREHGLIWHYGNTVCRRRKGLFPGDEKIIELEPCYEQRAKDKQVVRLSGYGCPVSVLEFAGSLEKELGVDVEVKFVSDYPYKF